MCKKLSIEDCHKIAKKLNGCCLEMEYTNNRTQMLWKCYKGHIWKATIDSIKNQKTWCPDCYKKKRMNCIEDCHKIAEKNGGMCLSKKYINAWTSYIWKCKNGHKWKESYHHVKQKGRWCKKCKIQNNFEHLHKLAKINGGKCNSSGWFGVEYKYEWECGDCGFVWAARYRSIKRGSWCPECSTWKTQKKLKNIVEKILQSKAFSNFSGFFWAKTKSTGVLKMDIWVPGKKLIIEYDGQQHFYPVRFGGMSLKRAKKLLKETKRRDKLKNKRIKDHPEDVKFFIRFNYKEPITEEYVKKKIIEAGIIIR